MTDKHHMLLSWVIAAFLVVVMMIGLAVNMWWIADDRQVMKWHKVTLETPQPVEAGNLIRLRVDIEKLRECAGHWQYWAEGPATYGLSQLNISSMEVGQRRTSVYVFQIPEWSPAGEYRIRRTSWHYCNPLRYQREDMPPVIVQITSPFGSPPAPDTPPFIFDKTIPDAVIE